ncbi:MAG: tail fiber domain-containing protein, partial [Bacteroidia bacterium]
NNGALANTTTLGFQAQATANNQVRIGNNGVTSIGGFAAWTNLSDGRYKKNIEKNVPGLEFIMQLEPVTYNFDFDGINKANKSIPESDQLSSENNANANVRFTGFIAQDVEKAAQSIGYDFSGVDKAKNENDFYGLRYSEFVVPMVKAIQEQQSQIETLKKQNAELMRRLTELENKK